MTLGKYIANKRIEEDLSQRGLARDIGIHHSTIAKIEKDTGISPDNNTLRAISKKLNIDYNYLLVLNNVIDDEPEIRIIQRAYKKMNSLQKEKMLRILEDNIGGFYG